MRGLVTAIRTLTILPCPGRDAKELSASLYWFPVVGLLAGGILYAASILPDIYSWVYWPEGVAVVLVGISILITRGLHLDGLSDCADAFWGGHDKKRILAIMKDSYTGTFGSAALFFVLLAKWVCFTRLIACSAQSWIIAAYIISRAMQVVLASSNRYARDEGGTGASFIQSAKSQHMVIALLVSLLLLSLISRLNPGWLFALAISWFITRALGALFSRKIDGVTGDLLGTTSEIIETSILAMGAIFC